MPMIRRVMLKRLCRGRQFSNRQVHSAMRIANNLLHSSAPVVQVPSLAREVEEKNFMAQHRSLKGASALGAKRNVLKRFERVELLKKRSQWKEGDRVTGLRKTKPEA